MQVYFNNFSTNVSYPKFGKVNNNAASSLMSAGKECVERRSEYIAHTNIRRIVSEEEFDSVLNKLMNHRTWMGGWWNRRSATKFEQALVPYTGEQDRHAAINRYMNSGHVIEVPGFTAEILQEYIRAMDYALPEIDKVYGKYSGIVYRCGEMDKVPKNFVSTARDPRGLSYIVTSKEDYYKPFYIIYTNHGHKIEEMQKKFCYKYEGETEIILDPGSHYEEITEITPEMRELERNMMRAIKLDDCRMPDRLKLRFLKEV